MKQIPMYALLLLFAVASCSTDNSSQGVATTTQAVSLESEDQQIAYAMGVNFASQIRDQGLTIELHSFLAGIEDGWGGRSRMTSDELANALASFQAQETERRRALADAQEAANREASERNLNAAREFFAENGQREGVTTTDSGLQFEVITAVDGPRPSETDTVKVHYRGTLLDGTEFDSSYARGEPATFPLDQVISGWTEGLQLMSAGSKFKLFVPSDLAYGPGGAGETIGPNAALIFDVELLAIVGVSDSGDE